jgi:hypothetical protein
MRPRGESLIDTISLPASLSGTVPAGDTPLHLSNALAVLSLEDDEVLVCHPAGRAVHLSAELWQLAQRFVEPRVPNVEEQAAAAFLKEHQVLWRNAAEERQAASHLVESADAAELPVIRPIAERFRQIVEPYDLDILATVVPYWGKVAMVGLCLAQQHELPVECSGGSYFRSGTDRRNVGLRNDHCTHRHLGRAQRLLARCRAARCGRHTAGCWVPGVTTPKREIHPALIWLEIESVQSRILEFHASNWASKKHDTVEIFGTALIFIKDELCRRSLC